MAHKIEAFQTLATFTFDETTPFAATPGDLASDLLGEAHAILLVVANLLEEQRDEEPAVRNTHMAKALRATCTLMALSAFATECAQEARQS
ncbi:hypothetical protein LH128_01237 [Sphingomonas sp. LH128]|uniref:hypothetical protein n=1 Tax=Sphingomonas sp. LH128 TaxID=473781 RepID=UPI00027CC489|nr:hypothetical protein [Sphingomonas sp. LH128]EJU14957.1 hypothetical protein LH128_01237 [Sphingomonas sp. LH128]